MFGEASLGETWVLLKDPTDPLNIGQVDTKSEDPSDQEAGDTMPSRPIAMIGQRRVTIRSP